MRDNQYTTEGRIRFSEVDHTRRITLPGIVNYFQDCSTFQSEDLGLGIMHCSERKRAWILSSWQVVVERYPEITLVGNAKTFPMLKLYFDLDTSRA